MSRATGEMKSNENLEAGTEEVNNESQNQLSEPQMLGAEDMMVRELAIKVLATQNEGLHVQKLRKY